MECDICLEAYDLERRRPKVLPCGHSACLSCLKRLAARQCPVCRKGFPGTSALPDNYTVLRFIDESANTKKENLWCAECKSVARASCELNHRPQSVQTALQVQVGQLKVQLLQVLQDLQGLAAGCSEEQALAALQFLCSPSYDITVRRQGGDFLSGTLAVGAAGQKDAVKEKIVKVLALTLIKGGALPKAAAQAQDNHRDEARPPHPSRSPQQPTPPRSRPPPAVQARPPIHSVVAEVGTTGSVIESLDVGHLTTIPSFQGSRQKAALLDRVLEQGVRRLTNVHCDEDPNWTLLLLNAAAQRLEELQLWDVGLEHLQALQHLPQLRRLAVSATDNVDDDDDDDDELFQNPFVWPLSLSANCNLQKFQAWYMPRDTVLSLIRANKQTLEEVHVLVGHKGSKDWPSSCRDLADALEDCGLTKLKHLVLWRDGDCSHSCDVCRVQLADVQGVLPGVTVECSWCDRVVPWMDLVKVK